MRLTMGLVVALLATSPVVTSAQGAYMTYSSNTTTVHRGSVPSVGEPFDSNNLFDELDRDPKTSEEAKADALKACVGSDASATACAAAITALVEALKRENTGADATKKIDSAIGNFAYELYGAQPIGSLDATKRAILSSAINQLADSVTDSVQKSSIKSVASSVGEGKTAQKSAFYQNSASISTLTITTSLDSPTYTWTSSGDTDPLDAVRD